MLNLGEAEVNKWKWVVIFPKYWCCTYPPPNSPPPPHVLSGTIKSIKKIKEPLLLTCTQIKILGFQNFKIQRIRISSKLRKICKLSSVDKKIYLEDIYYLDIDSF